MSHPLVERLRSSKPDERISACSDAVEDPSAIVLIDTLGEALGDPVKAVARAASDALARLARKIDGVEPVVRLALRSDDASRRWHAALTSARIEPPTPRLLPPIVEALASCEGDVRWMAARLLVEVGRVNPEVLPLVVGLVTGGESAEVRRMATHCVRELGPERPESTRALLEGTRDADRSVRHGALTALAGLTDPSGEVFDRLMEVITDPSDAPSRKMAAYSLGALAREHADELPKASIAALRQIAKADPDPDLRSVAGRTLEQLGKPSEVAPLLPVAMDPKPIATDRFVFETGAVRAVRPDHPLAPGHLVIEPIEAVESLLTLEDELLAELMTAVKRAVQEIVRVHGACRVHTDIGAHSTPLRWHVYAPPS